MTSYFIFKTDGLTGKTSLVCCGSHNTEEEIGIHWQSYMYGFMDGAHELLGSDFEMKPGDLPSSFTLIVENMAKVTYFMLTGDEGPAMVNEICRQARITE